MLMESQLPGGLLWQLWSLVMLGRLDLQTESAGNTANWKILYRTMVRVYVLVLIQISLLYLQVPHIQHQNLQWQLAQRLPVQV